MKIKKEIIIFISCFIILSILMHYKEFLEYPLLHIQSLPNSSLGVYHPIYLTLLVYIIILFIRFISSNILKLIKR